MSVVFCFLKGQHVDLGKYGYKHPSVQASNPDSDENHVIFPTPKLKAMDRMQSQKIAPFSRSVPLDNFFWSQR